MRELVDDADQSAIIRLAESVFRLSHGRRFLMLCQLHHCERRF